MRDILYIVQIAVALSLTLVILLQARGSGLSTVFGGGGGFYRSRRGVEKLFIYATITLSIVFLLLSAFLVIY